MDVLCSEDSVFGGRVFVGVVESIFKSVKKHLDLEALCASIWLMNIEELNLLSALARPFETLALDIKFIRYEWTPARTRVEWDAFIALRHENGCKETTVAEYASYYGLRAISVC